MKNLISALLLLSASLIPWACGQNSSPVSPQPTATSTAAAWTPTVTMTSTASPVRTATSTLTASMTATLTSTITATASLTPTNSATASPTPTNSPTATYTPTLTATVTLTFTVTVNPTPGYGWYEATSGAAFSSRAFASGLVYNSTMWIMGGYSYTTGYLNDIWSSTNGSTWTQSLSNTSSPGSSQFSQRFGMATAVYNNAMWVMGGQTATTPFNDVWSSTNGSSWTQVLANTASPGSSQFGQRYAPGCVVFNNALWLMGGYSGGGNLNDVWTSANGSSWTQELANTNSPGSTQFSQRQEFGCVVFNNAIWVIGGQAGTYFNDVWSSTNGSTWTQSPAAPFSARCNFACFVYNNAIWVVGGNSNSSYLNDAWYTTNGSSWTQALTNTSSPLYDQFTQRQTLSGLVYNNQMWIMAGSLGGSAFNDVWYSPL